MNPMEYVKPELLVLIPVLYFAGIGIKKSALIKDNLIPLILGAVGIAASALLVLATSDIGNYKDALMAGFVALTQGVLCAGCSVYVNQIIKQANKGE